MMHAFGNRYLQHLSKTVFHTYLVGFFLTVNSVFHIFNLPKSEFLSLDSGHAIWTGGPVAGDPQQGVAGGPRALEQGLAVETGQSLVVERGVDTEDLGNGSDRRMNGFS